MALRKPLLAFIGAVAIFVCVLTGCTGKPNSAEIRTPPIKIALSQDIASFDPTKVTDVYSETVLRCIYTTLFDFDETLRLRPRLVKTVTQLDSKTFELKLHENATFGDGSSLTADDVIFSLERARTSEKQKKNLEQLDRLEKMDDHTLLLSSKDGSSGFLDIFARVGASILSRKVGDPSYDFSVPLSSGPYTLVNREEGSMIELSRYSGYYLGPAENSGLRFLVMDAAQERTAALLNGELDIIPSVSAYDCQTLALTESVKLLESDSTKVEFLALNLQQKPFDDPRVREAVHLAINRQKLTQDVYYDYSEPADHIIPKGILGHIDWQNDYDPTRAAQLLAEAGYSNGFSMTVYTPYTLDATRKNLLEYIKLDLAAVKITLSYSVLELSKLSPLIDENSYEAVLKSWTSNSDPDSMLPVLFGSDSTRLMNTSNYQNPEVDRLLAQGRSEQDPDKRKALYETVNQLLYEDHPVIVLHTPKNICAAQNGVSGLHMNSQGLFQLESLRWDSL